MAGDRGYSYPRVRKSLRARRIRGVIPERRDQIRHRKRGRPPVRDWVEYRARNVIERAVGWHKESRRIGTRFEKLAVNYLAMNHVALIARYLRRLESSDRT